jgi:uncharacterized protein
MKFWDSSALVPLLIAEDSSERLVALRKADPNMVVWWGSETECLSALARREREGILTRDVVVSAECLLEDALESACVVLASSEVRHFARRLLFTHPLRAADALQLGAALLFAGNQVRKLPIVTMDKNLAECAGREGFPVEPGVVPLK